MFLPGAPGPRRHVTAGVAGAVVAELELAHLVTHQSRTEAEAGAARGPQLMRLRLLPQRLPSAQAAGVQVVTQGGARLPHLQIDFSWSRRLGPQWPRTQAQTKQNSRPHRATFVVSVSERARAPASALGVGASDLFEGWYEGPR